MSFEVDDFHDLVRLLEQHPEWRAELRRLIAGEELLTLVAGAKGSRSTSWSSNLPHSDARQAFAHGILHADDRLVSHPASEQPLAS